MQSKIKSSFIPKKPVMQAAKTSSSRYKSGGMDIVMLVSVVALVVSSVLSAGVFLYKNFAASNFESKKQLLEKTRGAFEPKLIEQLMKLSERIRVAEGIVEKHTAPSVFLNALEQDSLTNVQFIKFEYTQKNTDIATFSLKGKTTSVNSVALQSSRFGDSNIIKDSIFSNIDLVKDGVTFEVEGEIDLNAIRYSNLASTALLQRDTAGSIEDLRQDDFGEFGEFDNIEQ